MSIFRAYDIRGIYPSEVNEELAEKIGKAFGTFLPDKSKIAVGGDVRVSTPQLKDAFMKGLVSTGADVIDIGMAPTPMVYFAVASQKLGGGMIVTASVDAEEYTLVQHKKTKKISLVKVGEFIDKKLITIDYKKYNVLAFDTKTNRVSFKRINSIYKHKINEPLYEIILQGGRKVRVTASHSVFTQKEGKIISLPTKHLKIGDLVPVPSSVPSPNLVHDIDIIQGLWPHRHELRKILVSGKDIIEINRKRNSSKRVKKIKLLPEGRRLLWNRRLSMGLSRRMMGKVNGMSPITIQRMEIGAGRDFVKGEFIQHYASNIGLDSADFLSQYTDEEGTFDQNFKDGRTLNTISLKEIKENEIKQVTNCRLRGLHNPQKAISNMLEITPDIARIIGYYVAEGSLECEDRIVFSLGLPERGHERFITQDIITSFKKSFNITPAVYKRKHNSVKLAVDSVVLYGLFSKILGFEGRKSHTKHVPDFIFSLPPEHKIEFLKGVFLGDGSLNKEKWIRFSSTSEELAIGISYLLMQLGIAFSYARRKDKRTNRKDMFVVLIANKTDLHKIRPVWKNHWNAKSIKTKYIGHKSYKLKKGDLLLLPIKEIKKVSPSSEYVYDFSVDGETFIAGAGGICCHNSHNPSEYNGFKPVGPKGVCFSWETGIKKLHELVENRQFRSGEGSLEKKDIEQAYIDHLISKTDPPRGKKVVIDPANGACSIVAPKVFKRLGWDVVKLNCEPDGTFPSHEADPIKKKNLVQLQEAVLKEGADLGIAYDADGDRLGTVNEKGEVVDTSSMFPLFIKETLEKTPGAPIVYEVVVSKAVEDSINRFGGVPILSRVGHSYIQANLNEKRAALAGENSGHYYFPENFGYDDALFASLKAAELLKKATLSERQKEIPAYITSEEFRPLCKDDRKFQVVEQLQKRFQKQGLQVTDIDGARVVFDKGWFIIRASNTGPQLVVRWEAEDKDEFEKIEKMVRESLAAEQVQL